MYVCDVYVLDATCGADLPPVRYSELVETEWVAAGYDPEDTHTFLSEYRRCARMITADRIREAKQRGGGERV